MEVVMPGGMVLHVYTPDGDLTKKLEKVGKAENVEVDDLYNLVIDILNNNEYMTKVNEEEVRKMRVTSIKKIIEAYGRFITEVQSNPN